MTGTAVTEAAEFADKNIAGGIDGKRPWLSGVGSTGADIVAEGEEK